MPYRRIFAPLGSLLDGAKQVVLDSDAVAGASTITVKSIVGVAVSDILLFRDLGNESSEIVAVHASTTPSGNTITLAATLVESHPAGTVVYLIKFNQVRFYHSATEVNANSDDASLTALAAAVSIDPTTEKNYYDDTAQSSGYYYWRFINSIASINGLYSDAIPWGSAKPQFAKNEVGYLLDSVAKKVGREYDEKFSREDAMAEINACLDYQQGKLKHWARYLVSDYVLGQSARGVFELDLPADIYDNQSNKSVLNVRLGSDASELIWKDEKEFDNLMGQATRSLVRTQPSVGATSLNIVNSYDLDAAGTIHIYTDNTDDQITYTGVTRSATVGVLTGVPASGDGSIAVAHAVSQNVWQNPEEGKPKYFTIRNGKLVTWPLASAEWVNKNYLFDYYEEATTVDSESDTIDADRYGMVKHWLLWQARNYWFNNGKEDMTDGDYVIFREILNDQIRKAVPNQKFKMRPKLNRISYRSETRRDFDRE